MNSIKYENKNIWTVSNKNRTFEKSAIYVNDTFIYSVFWKEKQRKREQREKKT